MVVDIIVILTIIAFAIIGACSHFNKTSRRIYSLLTGMGLMTLLLATGFKHLNAQSWYVNIGTSLGITTVMNVVVYVTLFTLGSIVLSFILSLLYKLIQAGIASICGFSSVVCGTIFGAANALILVFVVFGFLALFNVHVTTNLFETLTSTVQIM